jgi:hypothetical protein
MKLKSLSQAISAAFRPMYVIAPGFENPQQPSFTSELFVPDQLIAGRFPLVTAQNVTLTGALALQRGAVLGQATLGSATVAAGAQAANTLTFSGQPVDGNTVTVNGTLVTFKAPGTILGANQVAIGANLGLTIDALIDFLNASADVNIAKARYTAAGTVVTMTSVLGGVAGNAYTLAAVGPVMAVGGATFAGGIANTGNGAFTLDPTTPILAGATPGVYTARCTVAAANAATFRLTDPNGAVLQDGAYNGAGASAPFADRIKFTITDGATDFVVGDTFYVTVLLGAGKYKLSVASALDGSQKPSAILADYADPSAGDVVCAIYLTGEFNANAINYDASWEPSALLAALRPYSIFLRSVLPATGTIINK